MVIIPFSQIHSITHKLCSLYFCLRGTFFGLFCDKSKAILSKLIRFKHVKMAIIDIYTFLGDARFASITYRLFKLPPGTKTEPTQVKYKGHITGYEDNFKFDHQYAFKVCILSFFLTCLYSKYFSYLLRRCLNGLCLLNYRMVKGQISSFHSYQQNCYE